MQKDDRVGALAEPAPAATGAAGDHNGINMHIAAASQDTVGSAPAQSEVETLSSSFEV